MFTRGTPEDKGFFLTQQSLTAELSPELETSLEPSLQPELIVKTPIDDDTMHLINNGFMPSLHSLLHNIKKTVRPYTGRNIEEESSSVSEDQAFVPPMERPVSVCSVHYAPVEIEMPDEVGKDKIVQEEDQALYNIRNCEKYFKTVNLNPGVIELLNKFQKNSKIFFRPLDGQNIDMLLSIATREKYKYNKLVGLIENLLCEARVTQYLRAQDPPDIPSHNFNPNQPRINEYDLIPSFNTILEGYQETLNLNQEANTTQQL